MVPLDPLRQALVVEDVATLGHVQGVHLAHEVAAYCALDVHLFKLMFSSLKELKKIYH